MNDNSPDGPTQREMFLTMTGAGLGRAAGLSMNEGQVAAVLGAIE